jgi:hypothetical protein
VRIEERYFSLPSQFNNPAEVAPTISFKPPRLWRRAPGWMDQLEEIDPGLSDLLKQVYSAANDEQVKLLSMGIRAALDHVMIKMLGGDFGGFEQKLSQMVEQGHLTPSQKDDLEIVIDAGSASSHRGYRPPRELIDSMMMTMETLIQTHSHRTNASDSKGAYSAPTAAAEASNGLLVVWLDCSRAPRKRCITEWADRG